MIYFFFRIISRAKQFVILLGAWKRAKSLNDGASYAIDRKKNCWSFIDDKLNENHCLCFLSPFFRPAASLAASASSATWSTTSSTSRPVSSATPKWGYRTEYCIFPYDKNRNNSLFFLPDTVPHTKKLCLCLPVCESDIATFAETRTLCAPKYIGVFFVFSV